MRAAVSAAAATTVVAPLAVRSPSIAESFWTRKPMSSKGSDGISALQGVPVKMFQYEICPFCNKIKAVLDFCKVSYETVEVNPLSKAQLNFTKELDGGHAAHNYRKVPLAVVGHDVVADSPVILDRLLQLLASDAKAASNSRVQSLCKTAQDSDVKQWITFADKELSVLLFPNLTRTFEESYEAFGYVNEVPGFSLMDKLANQWMGATAMWLAQGKIKKKYNITDERKALHDCIARWTNAVGNKDFMGGSSPNLADLCVFGTLRSLEGMATHREVLSQTDIRPWYERMSRAVGERNCCRSSRT